MKTGGFLHNPKEIVGGKNDYDFRKLLLFAIDDPQLSWPRDQNCFRQYRLLLQRSWNLVHKEPQSEQGYFRIVRIDGSDKTDFYINGNELVGYVAQKDYASIIKSLQGMKSIEAMSEVSFVEVPSLTKKKLKKIQNHL